MTYSEVRSATSHHLKAGTNPASPSHHRSNLQTSRTRPPDSPSWHHNRHARDRDCTNAVQDVLFPSGVIRSEVSLRAAITKGCRQRCIYLTHRQTVEALERYLAYRIERDLGTELTAERYRN